ncbi:MAG: cytochrome c3 family protein [Rhodoferax sp.]|nr:cytochrome c3 family protein [Rhodoferax sp.]
MKFSLNKLVIATVLAVPAITMASTGGSGMLGGRHDFASATSKFLYKQTNGVDGTVVTTANKVGLCSFCHTPHSASSTALLWNRGAPTQAYAWADATATTGGTTLGIASTYVGPTAKCLACHDGSVAVGDVGNYMSQSRTGNSSFNTYKVGDRAAEAVGDTAPKVTKKVGAGGDMTGTHPVGVPYPFGGVVNSYNGVDTGTNVVLGDYVAAPTISSGTGVDTVAGVKLYNHVGSAITAGAIATKTGIECSSCHDVHNKQSVDDNMLRGKQAGSSKADGYLCLQCHAKAD